MADESCCEHQLWAVHEFGRAVLGDRRRNARICRVAAGLSERPGRAISTCCGRNGAQAVSRLFAREEVNVDSVLQSHYQATHDRCLEHKSVFVIQDTSFVDLSGHPSTKGLGTIGTSDKEHGLCMHSVLLMSEQNVPLGLVGMQIWARDAGSYGISESRSKRPTCEKESNRWIVGLDQAQQHIPEQTSVLVISDRESDIYDYFASQRRDNVDLLVRLAQDRRVIKADGGEALISDALESADVVGYYEVELPDRVARMKLCLTQAHILAPEHMGKSPADIKVRLIWAHEVEPGAESDALDWKLATTVRVEGFEGAKAMVDAYTGRWVIEEFHRVLKSGCKIEKMQFDDAQSLEPAIALNAAVACRILHLTKLGRSSADADASLVANELEVQVAQRYMSKMHERDLYEIKTVGQFVRAVALIGGFMGRKRDGNPGTKVIWQGLQRLADLVDGYGLGLGYAQPSP